MNSAKVKAIIFTGIQSLNTVINNVANVYEKHKMEEIKDKREALQSLINTSEAANDHYERFLKDMVMMFSELCEEFGYNMEEVKKNLEEYDRRYPIQ